MQSSEGTQTGPVKRAALTAAMAAIVAAGLVAVTSASPPSGVTPTLLARGTYDSFKVSTDPQRRARVQGEGEVTRRHRGPPA